MDVFNYLVNDLDSISERLDSVAKNYSEWTQERVFEESKKAFASIKQHFSSESILENNLKNGQSIQATLSEIEQKKNKITNEVESIVEIHVDEPGFEQALETIASQFKQYAQYCKDKFFPDVKNLLSADDLKRVSDQLEQRVLS